MGRLIDVLHNRKSTTIRWNQAGRISYILLLVIFVFTPLWTITVQAGIDKAAMAADIVPVSPEKASTPDFTLNTYCTPSLDNIGEVYCEAEAIGAPQNADLVYTWIWNGIKQTETGKVLHLTGIPEGNYEVQVKAMDPKSGIVGEMTSMRIQIQSVVQNDSFFEILQDSRAWIGVAGILVSLGLLFGLLIGGFLFWRRKKRTG